MDAELYRLLDAARQVINSNGYGRDIDDAAPVGIISRDSWLVSTSSMRELVRAVSDVEDAIEPAPQPERTK